MQLRIEDVLWKTRGLHWDYEFIAVPERPAQVGWGAALEALLGAEPPSMERLVYGELTVSSQHGDRVEERYAFAAVRFFDPERCDWTGRQVQHFAVWLHDDLDLDVLPGDIPLGWHLQTLHALAATYGSDDAFGLDEARARSRRDGPRAQSRAEHVVALVRGTAPVTLTGEVDERRWKRRDVRIKKKSAEPSLRVDSARPPARRRRAPHLVWVAALVVGIAIAIGGLTWFLTTPSVDGRGWYMRRRAAS